MERQRPRPEAPAEDTLVLATDQSRDSFVRAPLGLHASARLLYQRCQEACAQALPGQDYARVVALRGGATICFCVCDGVGSSYRGDFAARFLGEHLVAWLSAAAPSAERPRWVAPRLQADMVRWAREAQQALVRQPLPGQAAGLVGEVLEELRTEYGGEAVFLAGRLDAHRGASGDPPGGELPLIEALFCSLGNVAGQTYAGNARREIAPADDGNRWSSARALLGQLRVWTLPPSRLDRLIVYTDGASGLEQWLAAADDRELRERARALLATPASDDVTILDIAWRAAPLERGEDRGARPGG